MDLKSEIFKIWKSKKSKIFLGLILLIPFLDLISGFWMEYGDYLLHREAYKNGLSKSSIRVPALGAFLSGYSEGHIAQMLLIWILPIYLMLIYCDSPIQEKKLGYSSILVSKEKRKKIVSTKFLTSFLFAFVSMGVSLSINFLLANILFVGGTDFFGLEVGVKAGVFHSFMTFSIQHPVSVYMGYIFMVSLIAGGYSVFCTAVSMICPNHKLAYAIVFFVWIIQIISKYSLTYAMQPFIEYGPSCFIPAILIFLCIVLAGMVGSYVYKVKCDEI